MHWRYLSLLALLGSLCCNAAWACSKAIRITMMQWPPYIYTDEQSQRTGGDLEMIQAVFKEAKCRLEIIAEVPRKRRLAMFMAGELDMIPGSNDTAERREYAWFSKPYRLETVSLFTLPSNYPKYRDLDSFGAMLRRQVPLLVLNAGWFGAEYAQHSQALRDAKLSSSFETFGQGLTMLAKGRGDLIMADHATLLFEAAHQKMTIQALPFQASSAPVAMMFSKKSVAEADVLLLNEAIDRLEARGTLKQIRARYGIQQ